MVAAVEITGASAQGRALHTRRVGVVGDVVVDRPMQTTGHFPVELAGTKSLTHSRWGVRRHMRAFSPRPEPHGEQALGGDSTNNAFGRVKSGGESQVVYLLSTVGKGAADFVETTLLANNVIPRLTQHNRLQPTGYVVTNTHGGEQNRAIISAKPRRKVPQEVSFEGIDPTEIYLTSVVGKNWPEKYDATTDYAVAHDDVFLAIAPGTVQMKDKGPALYRAINRADALLVNREEALKLVRRDPSDRLPVPQLLDEVQALSERQMIVLITDDVNGSFVKAGNGRKYHAGAQIIPEEEVGSLLGAGDGYAAAFLQALSEKRSVPEAMVWGTLNASSIIRTTDAHSGQLTREKMVALVAGRHDFRVIELPDDPDKSFATLVFPTQPTLLSNQ